MANRMVRKQPPQGGHARLRRDEEQGEQPVQVPKLLCVCDMVGALVVVVAWVGEVVVL